MPRFAKKNSEPEDSSSSEDEVEEKIPTLKKKGKLPYSDLRIVDYSEKAIAVIGETMPHSNELAKLGGKFNARLKCGAGWIFPATRREILEHYIKTGEIKQFIPKKAEETSFPSVKIFEQLLDAFDSDEEYDGATIRKTIKKIQKKYTSPS